MKSTRTYSKLIVRIAITGVMLSLAVMILSVSIIRGFKAEIKEKVRGFIGDIQIFRFDLNGSFEKSPFVPSDTTIQILKNNPEVVAFYPFATKPAIISVNDEVEGVNFKGIDSTYRWSFIQKHLVSGTVIHFNDSTHSNQVLLSAYTANRLHLKVGDQFLMHFVQDPPRSRRLVVQGIYDLGIEQLDKSFVMGDIQLIRRINGWAPNEMGGMELRVRDFDRLPQVADQVYRQLEIKLRSRSVIESSPEIFTWLSLLDVNTQIILGLMLIVGLINMVTALLIMILERTNMIGILKAMGMSSTAISKVFLYHAMYLVGLGLVLGNALGLGLAFLQQETNFFKLNQANYYLQYVPIEVNWTEVLLLNIGTAFAGVVVLILPALLVSRISPLKAIRFK